VVPGHPDLELDLLATVFDVARIGICVIDDAGRFARVNPAFCALVDYPAERLIGQPYALCAPASVIAVQDKFLRAILGDSTKIPREWQIRRADDTLLDALVSFRSLVHGDGRRYAVVTFSDITESKRAKAQLEVLNRELEQRIADRTAELTEKITALTLETSNRARAQAELLDSERKYHRVINLTREGFWLINGRNETIEVNAALCRMLGYSEEQMLGRTPLEFVDDRYRPILEARLVPRPYPAEASYELELKRSDGSRMSAAYNATAVINERGEREFSFAFITDISERKRLEAELQRTLSEHQAILENSLVGIAFVRNRTFVWMNKAFEQDMLGYDEGELVGQSVAIAYPSQAVYEQLGPVINATLTEHGVFQTENRVRRKDGAILWCLVSGRAIDRHDLTRGSIWTIADITQRKAAEAEVLQTLEREKELSELKSRFVSMTSHEFRTPLAGIMSSIELLSDYGERLDAEERTELAGVIKSSVKRMTQMLDQVLLIGRADAGRMDFRPQPLDLNLLVTQVVDEVRSVDRDAPAIDVDWRVQGSGWLLDERIVRHVLTNLLGNAVKYSPQKEPVQLVVASSAQQLVFTVTDRGIGIPPEDRPLLFQSFHRGRNVGSISGTGLGLAIVKKAVDLHGGRIQVESQVGKGSRFRVFIPATLRHTDG
jgi:PAS domain S-box-containing protein